MDLPHVLAVWLHTLAFVIAWGYYGILGRMVLPALERSLDSPARVAALVAIERRALPLIALSLVLFTATGAYLLVADPGYQGLGNVFASTWTTLMLAKHVLVVGLIAVAAYVDVCIRRLGEATNERDRGSALRRLTWSSEGATGLGALIVLLTVAAQSTV